MTAERMRELLAAYVRAPLGDEEIAALGRYLDLLVRWNARMNLTAVRAPEEMVTRHFGESLAVAEWLSRPEEDKDPSTRRQERESLRMTDGARSHESGVKSEQGSFDSLRSFRMRGPRTLFDLGSGAGFPGAVIALHCPEIEVTLIESQQRKTVFLKEVIRILAIANCKVYAGRGEEMGARADVVTMRAVDRSGAMLTVAHGLLNAGGWLVMMGSVAQVTQVEESGLFAHVESVEAGTSLRSGGANQSSGEERGGEQAAGVHVIVGQRL